MKTAIEHDEYDTCLEASNWQYAAAIVGLEKYFHHHTIDFERGEECICYSSKEITRESYLQFAESYYLDEFFHVAVEQRLGGETYSPEQIKAINEKLTGNTIMKKTFDKMKFTGENQIEILEIIQENRENLICETFRNKKNMYANFANTNQLLKEEQTHSRLVGYYIDSAKKGKSISYNFNMDTYCAQDDPVFDFIPFAFAGSREGFFINDNITMKDLIQTNRVLKDQMKTAAKKAEQEGKQIGIRQVLFQLMIESADFIDYDVEVIYKNRDKDYFETLYMRKQSIDIFKKFKKNNIEYRSFCFSIKVTDQYYINIQKEVTDCILNMLLLDVLIEMLLKEDEKKGKYEYLVTRLIQINLLIRGGGERMKRSILEAKECAKRVAAKIPDNKLDSYRQKLTSAVVFKDNERVCQILLSLSNYADVSFDFAFDVFDDFEEHKDLVFSFINALRKTNTKQDTGSKEEN